ncbi:MAG: EamA family transporter [Thermoleophilaceae bacterium]
MSGGAFGLALGAAFLHAFWNVLLAGSRDSVAATGALLLFGTALLAPAALLFGGVSAEAVPFIAASAALELAYFALLALAYRDGELGVVYPVARGSAPVLVLAVAALGLGKGVSGLAAVGVVLVAAGVLLVGARGRWGGLWTDMGTESAPPPGGRRDLAFGLAIGVTIAGYTLVDSEGLDHADPLPYLFLITAAVCVVYCGALLGTGHGSELRAELRPRTLLTAAATFGAYAMVLAALQMAPAAPVAAVRESSIVIAAFMAWLFLGEERRLTGAALVAAGVAAIAYS